MFKSRSTRDAGRVGGKSTVRRMFAVDYRSLECFRIGLGVLVLSDLTVRAPYFRRNYTDFGVLPGDVARRELILSELWDFLSVGSEGYQFFLFCGLAVSAALLTAGLLTRIATLLTWVFLSAVQLRNPLINDLGDAFLQAMVFWSIFLPLGRAWSLDARRTGRGADPMPLSAATVAARLQLVFLYVFSALLKTGTEWHADGTAVYFALSTTWFIKPFGLMLLDYPEVMTCLTRATWYWELFAPMLLLVPFIRGPLRVMLVASFVLFQVGLNLSMRLGVFPWISTLAVVLFLPPGFWQSLGRLSGRIRPAGAGPAPEPPLMAPPPPPWPRPARILGGLFVTGCLLIVTASNLRGVLPVFEMPRWLDPVVTTLRLDQEWSMFAPGPDRNDGWFVMPGTLEDGRVVDLFRGEWEVDWSRPARISETFASAKNGLHVYTMRFGLRTYLRYYACWLCRDWNARHESKLVDLEIIYFHELVLGDGRRSDPVRMSLLRAACEDCAP